MFNTAKLINAIEKTTGAVIDRTRFLLIKNAFDKTSLFLYCKENRQPIIVARIPKGLQGQVRCQTEYDALLYLEGERLPRIIAPKPLGILKLENGNCYLQSVLISEIMLSSLPMQQRIISEKQLAIATDYLISIYLNTKSENTGWGQSFCRCYQHGDFWVGNLGLVDANLALYDAEFSQKDGYPLFDLLHFCMYYQVALDNIGKVRWRFSKESYNHSNDKRNFKLTKEIVGKVLIVSNATSQLVKKYILKYIKACSIDLEDARRLIKNYIEEDRKIIELAQGWEINF